MVSAKRVLTSLAAAGIVLYLVAALGVRGFYRKALYPIPARRISPPAGVGALRTAAARDGVPVHVIELPGPAGEMTVVYFHGNAETMSDNVDLALDLAKRGLGVMLVEYRGYGLSAGAEPTEEGLYLDAEAALDLLNTKGIPADRVILWGTSLGSGVAAEMAERKRGAALVLLAPYTSIPDMAHAIAPFVPTRFIGDRFDTLAKAPRISLPTLVMHGDQDEVIPVAMGRAVSAAIRGAQLLVVAGGHHSDLLVVDGSRLLDAVATLAHSVRR